MCRLMTPNDFYYGCQRRPSMNVYPTFVAISEVASFTRVEGVFLFRIAADQTASARSCRQRKRLSAKEANIMIDRGCRQAMTESAKSSSSSNTTLPSEPATAPPQPPQNQHHHHHNHHEHTKYDFSTRWDDNQLPQMMVHERA